MAQDASDEPQAFAPGQRAKARTNDALGKERSVCLIDSRLDHNRAHGQTTLRGLTEHCARVAAPHELQMIDADSPAH
jgi:hypothetical protein